MKYRYHLALASFFITLILFAALKIPGEWELIIPTEWRLTHWLFSYEFGFIKRGLIGSALSLITGQPGYYFLTICSLIVHLAAVYMLLVYSFRHLSPLNSARFKFLALFLASSATIQHLSWNLGRFDHFGVIILIVSLLILELDAPRGKWLIVPMCAAGILIHEAFFLLFFPFIFAASFYALRERKEQKTFCACLAFSGLAFLLLVTQFGRMESLDKELFLNFLAGKTDFMPDKSSIMVLYRSFEENLSYTLNAFLTRETLYNHLILFAWQLPTLISLYLFWHFLFKKARQLKEESYFFLLTAGTFAPLLLYIAGRDFYRWIAVVIFNMFLMLLFLAQNKSYLQCLEQTAVKYRLLIFAAVVTSLLAGPIGIEAAHPFKLIKLILN